MFLERETLIIHAGGYEPRVDEVIDWPPTGRKRWGVRRWRGWRTAALDHLSGSRHYRITEAVFGLGIAHTHTHRGGHSLAVPAGEDAA